MTDSEWATLFESSPKKAYEMLIENFGNLIYAIVINKLGNCGSIDDVEDCVSDIFVELLKNGRNFSEGSGSLKAYVSTIARNRAIDSYRKLSRKNSMVYSMEDDGFSLMTSAFDTETEVEKRADKQKLWETIKSLGEPDTSIIVYQYFYGFNVHKIASLLLMSPDSVQKRSIRARKKIKQILSEGDNYEQ